MYDIQFFFFIFSALWKTRKNDIIYELLLFIYRCGEKINIQQQQQYTHTKQRHCYFPMHNLIINYISNFKPVGVREKHCLDNDSYFETKRIEDKTPYYTYP